MYKMITNSDINGLITLKIMFPDLSRSWVDRYITSAHKVGVKLTIYRSVLSSFTMENHFQNYRFLDDHFLPLIENQKTPAQGKALNRAN